jgi:hypothetical protein
MSIPLPSIYQGLETIFEEWRVPELSAFMSQRYFFPTALKSTHDIDSH